MKALMLVPTAVLAATFLTACSDDANHTELQKAYTEAHKQTKAAIAETDDAIDSMKDSKKELNKVLDRLDSAMKALDDQTNGTSASN